MQVFFCETSVTTAQFTNRLVTETHSYLITAHTELNKGIH